MKLWHTVLIALSFGSVLVFAAKSSFEPVEAVSPDHAAMHFNLGKYQRLSGQPQKALESLQRALANQPQSFGIHAELGNTHVRLGDKANAAKHFQTALDLQPDHAESRCGLANLRLGENKHAEACQHLHRTLGNIAALGGKASVALNPSTPVSAVEHVLDLVDMVLIMTVNPGFGGQQYIATMEPKIRELRALIAARGLTDAVDIEVDGGIGPNTIAAAAGAGANILVAGSALYRDPEGLAHAVTDLRARAEAAFSG